MLHRAYNRGMPIEPDTKNWTWVTERECPECGFDASAVTVAELPALLRDNAASWAQVLRRSDVRDRPDDSTWSPLEYAAHVRDVYQLFGVRLALMLDNDDPVFEDWDQDATAVRDRYGDQDPAAVGPALLAAGESLAAGFEAVPRDAYGRVGRRSDGSVFTVETLARYLAHDIVHHLHDVAR